MPVTEDVYFTAFGLVLFFAFFSWIAFARLTMGRIERQMTAEGLPRPSKWDGIGFRVLWYATAIGLPVGHWNLANDPFIDVPLVRHYATNKDRFLARVFMVSNSAFLLVGLAGYWLIDSPVN